MTDQPRASEALRVELIDPIRDPSGCQAWSSLLENKAAGLFHSPPWLRAVADAYGFQIRAYVVRDASNAASAPLGGAAFCEIDDLMGRRVVSLPFSDACDPLAGSSEAWQMLFARFQSHGVPVNLRCLMDAGISSDPALSVTKRARWHRLSVAPSLDELRTGLTPSMRRSIRRAERAGVEVRPLDSDEGMEGFYRLHVALRKHKYRLLAQPPKFFAAIQRRFCEVAGWHPLGAFLNGQLIAATIYLRWGDTLYYKFNASALDRLAARPNHLLAWAGVSLAKSLDCQTLDLGPSDDDQPGLIRFKHGLGAHERELRFLRWTPPGWRDEGAGTRRSLSEMTSRLTAPETSDELTGHAGAALYHLFA